jgi:ubiquinone/menaquinone biosynthesis C-methylase UbiE
MAAPYTQTDSAKHMYNSRAPNYDNSFHPVFAQHIADSLDLKPGEKLLDLACGTGLVTLPAARAVGATGRVVGVDITDGMLAELQRKRDQDPEAYKHVTIIEHDITKLDEIDGLEKASFDAISCASALVLLREPGVALQRWEAYLKPGGRLITDATDRDNMPQVMAMERVYHRLGVEPPNHRLWSVDGSTLRKALIQAGLEVEKVWLQPSTGVPTTYHEVGEWESRFDSVIYDPSNKALVDRGLVDDAKPLFKEEWEKLAIHDGKIKATDEVWVALARKPSASPPIVVKGSCACHAITWTAFAQPGSSCNCYCSICRKMSGSPFITFVEFPLGKVRFDPPLGKPYMQIFKASEHAERGFCGQCGSTLWMWYKNDADVIYVAAGSIDEEGSIKDCYQGPRSHIFASDVPGWYRIPKDGLPREETMPGIKKLLG